MHILSKFNAYNTNTHRHAHTHTHARTHTYTRMHARAHTLSLSLTHTHTQLRIRANGAEEKVLKKRKVYLLCILRFRMFSFSTPGGRPGMFGNFQRCARGPTTQTRGIFFFAVQVFLLAVMNHHGSLPLRGSSLHKQNSVDSLFGILSLFTARLRLQMSSNSLSL